MGSNPFGKRLHIRIPFLQKLQDLGLKLFSRQVKILPDARGGHKLIIVFVKENNHVDLRTIWCGRPVIAPLRTVLSSSSRLLEKILVGRAGPP